MNCPICDRPTRVRESRSTEAGASTRRRRVCSQCGHRFTTYERRERRPLAVIKRNGERQRFDSTKLRAALLRSTHKRQVSASDVEALVERVAIEIEAAGGELGADRIGDACLEGLRALDHGAYLQFLGTLPSPEADRATEKADFAESAQAGSVRVERNSSVLPAKTAG